MFDWIFFEIVLVPPALLVMDWARQGRDHAVESRREARPVAVQPAR